MGDYKAARTHLTEGLAAYISTTPATVIDSTTAMMHAIYERRKEHEKQQEILERQLRLHTGNQERHDHMHKENLEQFRLAGQLLRLSSQLGFFSRGRESLRR